MPIKCCDFLFYIYFSYIFYIFQNAQGEKHMNMRGSFILSFFFFFKGKSIFTGYLMPNPSLQKDNSDTI